jgi:excisionase family DNA binding protein
MSIEPEQVDSVRETAAALGISEWSVKMLLRAGKLRAKKSGRRTLVLRQSRSEYVASLPVATYLPLPQKRKPKTASQVAEANA